MEQMTAIAPGAQVRGTDGIIGTVEGLDSGIEGQQDGSRLLVRDGEGTLLYRLPSEAINRIVREGAREVVILNLPARLVRERYAQQEATVQESMGSHAIEQEVGAQGAAERWLPANEEETLRIPLLEEELTIEKQPISLGRVYVHKGVQEREQRLSIPIYREEAVIEHISPAEYDATAPRDPDEIIIPVVEERIVFEKRRYITEYIRVRKTRVMQEETIQDTVRREFVEVREAPEGIADGTRAPLFRVI